MAERIHIDLEWLKQIYEEENSIPKTAARSGLSYGTVRSRLIEAGVELKPRGGRCVGDEKMTPAERVYKHRRVRKNLKKQDT